MSHRITLYPQNRMRSNGIKEKDSLFMCPANTVLTGRCHSGDENGTTWYEYSSLSAIDINGATVDCAITTSDIVWSSWFKESSGSGFDASDNRVIVGRQHKGDENGQTRYATAKILFNGKPAILVNRIPSNTVKESKGIWVTAGSKQFMTGRHHSGDENGITTYCQGYVTV